MKSLHINQLEEKIFLNFLELLDSKPQLTLKQNVEGDETNQHVAVIRNIYDSEQILTFKRCIKL